MEDDLRRKLEDRDSDHVVFQGSRRTIYSAIHPLSAEGGGGFSIKSPQNDHACKKTSGDAMFLTTGEIPMDTYFKKLVEYFNKSPRICTLSTASKDGKVNAAVFGTPRMIDQKTVVMGLGKNRTFANLQENPHAVFVIMEPGETAADWKGVRVYLQMTDCQTSGKRFEEVKADVTKRLGENAAKIIHAAVAFEVQEIRPVADFG